MTMIARGATYNGSPHSVQEWTETYRRTDGTTFTIRCRRDQWKNCWYVGRPS